MAFTRIPRILKLVYPNLLWELPGEEKILFLTFDDGPTPMITEEILSILEKLNAYATFFCVGRNAERHPDILAQIIEKGHSLGNHTYSHLKGWFTKNREYYEDIMLAAGIIRSPLFRPAYGMIKPSQVQYLKNQFRIILWDIMSYDFSLTTSKEKCLENVLRHAQSGSIVVFHDSVKASENMLYALPRVLEYFGEKGFAFKSILPDDANIYQISNQPFRQIL
jgi:peptidoglycan/xylan/chitin deacetylase (PgdA/CDA1 family)